MQNTLSHEHRLHNLPSHVSEAVITALEAVKQLRVVDAKLLENRGLQIVDMHGILRNIVTKIISRTVTDPWLDSCPCHPNCKAPRVMVAPVIVGCQFALRVIGAPKFATPH